MDYQQIIRKLGKTDQERADALGLERSTVSRLRRGETAPSVETYKVLLSLQKRALQKLAKAMTQIQYTESPLMGALRRRKRS